MATDLVNQADKQTFGSLNATQVSEQGKVIARAIKDGEQAWRIFTEIELANKERNITDGVIC